MNIVGLLELHFINTKFANYLDLYEYLLLLKVIWSKLYSDKSSSDKGTLFQLKNVINRTAVPSDPKNIVQSTEDFLELVLVAHIMLAAEKEYSDGLTLEEVADKIVTKFVQLEPLPAGKCD